MPIVAVIHCTTYLRASTLTVIFVALIPMFRQYLAFHEHSIYLGSSYKVANPNKAYQPLQTVSVHWSVTR